MKAITKRLALKKSSDVAHGARVATPLPAAKSARPKPVGTKIGTALGQKPRVAALGSAIKPTSAARSKPIAGKSKAVRLFQIFYEDSHKKTLDPDFEPYDTLIWSSDEPMLPSRG